MDNNITPQEIQDTETPKPETVEVVGIKFRQSSTIYYFAPESIEFKEGECAIVETARGIELGTVAAANKFVPVSEVVAPLKSVLRMATQADIERNEENRRREKEAVVICAEKIRKNKLEMKLIDAEYTFDNSKLIFYFIADGRVDFRELLKDLAPIFKTRLDLRQIGIRDEAKLLGGLGVCGRPFCCSTFLSDFAQVSIKMAKEQSLSLNSAKISGACGRLMCCLRYEYDTYEAELKLTPPVDSIVKTSDGTGVVIETYPLTGKIKVLIKENNNTSTKIVSRDDVVVIKRAVKEENDNPKGNKKEKYEK